MERALQKLAAQLNQYDASSLNGLWDRYAKIVANFEPTRRWEEAVLALSMIQAVHWKNQLFNCGMIEGQERERHDRELEKQLREKLEYLGAPKAEPRADNQQSRVNTQSAGAETNPENRSKPTSSKSGSESGIGGESHKRRKILPFPTRS